MAFSVNATGPPPLRVAPDWSQWTPNRSSPWSLQIAEDVMVVDPADGALAALPPEAANAFGPLLAPHAELQFAGTVVTLTTTLRNTVAEALAEASQLRSELARTLRSAHGHAAVAAGLHPWSEAPAAPTLAPPRSRPPTEVAGILGRSDPTCAATIAVTVPDGDAAVRALDGLRLELPLILALAANSPFWRGRYTGLASTRTALRASGCQGGLPRSFGSYTAYTAALDALIRSGAIASASAVGWDVRLRPERGAIEVLVMDSQSRISDLGSLAALVVCLTRRHAESDGGRAAIPELVLENRAAAIQKGMRAELIDPAGHFVQPAVDELGLVVEACAPVSRELGCARELAAVQRNVTDPGHSRQRSLAANVGMSGLVTELIHEFTGTPVVAVTA
jgi:glutamate---cysteine ligase / carboxylate-amine ligase